MFKHCPRRGWMSGPWAAWAAAWAVGWMGDRAVFLSNALVVVSPGPLIVVSYGRGARPRSTGGCGSQDVLLVLPLLPPALLLDKKDPGSS